MSAQSVLVTLVIPILGVLIGNFMWMSPLKAVMEAREKHSLGTLNPIPFGITVLNCIGWTGYGLMTQNFYIFYGNCLGLTLGIFYSISSMAVLYSPHINAEGKVVYKIVEFLVVGGVFFWCVLGSIVGIAFPLAGASKEVGDLIIGWTSVGCAMLYYMAPCSTMMKIIREKDASTIYLPTIGINFINATLWFFYGLIGLNDPVVYAPQIVGLVFCTIQCCLAFMYPRNMTRNFSIKLPVGQTDDIDDNDVELGTPESVDGGGGEDKKSHNEDFRVDVNSNNNDSRNSVVIDSELTEL